jgi:predicted nucleic acid-binding protein
VALDCFDVALNGCAPFIVIRIIVSQKRASIKAAKSAFARCLLPRCRVVRVVGILVSEETCEALSRKVGMASAGAREALSAMAASAAAPL